jgi:hypothetical protein
MRHSEYPAPTVLPWVLALALVLPIAYAGAAEHRSHGAHAHGLARLDLAMEGGLVLIGLESPAANIVGFEHAPASLEERAALDRAMATLKDGARLFHLPAEAGCRLVEATVETPLAGEAGEAAGAEAHADIDAEYRFECAEPDRLVQMELGLFEVFPATHGLQVQFVGPKGQGVAELTAASPVLRF